MEVQLQMMDAPPPPLPCTLTRAHVRRLREMWRSAGWPCRDLVEAELIAAGLLERERGAAGRETLRVTDAGVRAIAASLPKNRAARGAHEALVERVAREMHRAGRVVWRGLALRAPLAAGDGATAWAIAMPDVYSIRHTTVEDYVEPVVHEVQVRRADLLGDLRRQAKRAAYQALASQCWYVLGEGIGDERDVPDDCGVLVATAASLDVARPAPRRAMRLPFAVWMALARAEAQRVGDEEQGLLGGSHAWTDKSAT